MMINLTVNKKAQEENAKYCRQHNITIPTFKMMKDPTLVPQKIKERLKNIGLWEVDPANLYRVTWKNEPKEKGGGLGTVNHIVLPPELTGCKASIIVLTGKYFPTGAHKVGATFGCLIPKLITGQFNPATDFAVWPSTGNFCRGGAYISALLSCKSIAILPQNMSKERFEWLSKVAGEIIATPGCESNVKEIFDKCWELKKTRKNVNIFNQFEELGNPTWHYNVTGPAIEEVLRTLLGKEGRFAGGIFSSGSGGTLGAGYYLKSKYPNAKVAAAEALECPTLLNNGFGDHRIEGIGDKHVPWIHDMKNTDMAIAVDDERPIRLLRLFNEKIGRDLLKKNKVNPELVEKLDLLGISGIANVLAAIKFAKFYELDGHDYVATVATDSMQLYASRLQELSSERGAYNEAQANMDLELLRGTTTDNVLELGYYERKRIHNLKYFTWIEQQQRDVAELNAQWYDRNYWTGHFNQAAEIDHLIEEFNQMIQG
ncbi:MAG TPA: pyridoxal-phosphate dependent enzyme [Bacteriovoracaceae bacterium]|nr:pyridoxal-phosphate dependent enzyme [Bacteriovoracaceae bacterium]